MAKIIKANRDEIDTLFTKEEIKFLSNSWANYLDYDGKIYTHLLPNDLDKEVEQKIISAIEGTHPYSSTVWIYKMTA